MGSHIIQIGIGLLVACGIGYLLTNPDFIRGLRQQIAEFTRTARQSQGELQGLKADITDQNRVPDDADMNDQVDDLRVGELAELVNLGEMKCTGLATIIALNNLGGGNFSERGEEWRLWKFQSTAILIHRPEGWYLFPWADREALTPEGAEPFNTHGEIFSKPPYRQKAWSYSFTWERQKLTFFDVGYYRVRVQDGTIGTQDGMTVKYALCKGTGGKFILMTNNKIGTDYLFGNGEFIGEDISSAVTKLTRVV